MRKIVFILFVIFSNYSSAQLTEEEASNAIAKYWLYRWRFDNDFIKVGDQMGESLPVAERAANNKRIFRWGDGAQKLGMYICLLATEYKLLYSNQRWVDLEKTKTELYYAIEAYRRLDCSAEWYRPYYKDPDFDWCNGYFMRGDLDIDFLSKPAKPWDPSNTQTNVDLLNQPQTDFCYDINSNIYSGPVDELRIWSDPWGDDNCSEFAAQEYDPSNNGDLVNEESQDQAICIIQGLGSVIILVPDGMQQVTLTDGSIINYDFVGESKGLTDQLLWYIKKRTHLTYSETQYQAIIDWIIKNPDNDNVERGAAAFQFSYPFAEIGNYLVLRPYFYNWHDYMTNAFHQYWNLQQINLSGNGNYGDLNTSMQCQLAAMSNSWYAIISPQINLFNTTPLSLYAKSEDHDWEAFYLPLWSIWHNEEIPNSIKGWVFSSIYDDINSAPCEGPYRFIVNGSPVFHTQWAGVFKYFKEINITHNGGNLGIISGFYNGNDYMLLNNFHYLISDDPLPFFHNLIDRIIDYDVPGTMFASGVNNLNAFNTITANSIVESGNEINYRAGYDITFKPGFHAEAGTDFHAWVEPFTCVNGEYRNENADSALATAYGFNERFAFKNHGIIKDQEEEEGTEEITNENLAGPDISKYLLIYPNPAHDKFTYLIPEKTGELISQRIEIFNMLGELIFSQQVNYSGQNVIGPGNLTPGIYIVRVISGEVVYSTQLMVE